MPWKCGGVCLIFDCAQHGFDQTEDVTGDVKVVSLLVTCIVGAGKRSIHRCAGISCSQFSVSRKVEPRMPYAIQVSNLCPCHMLLPVGSEKRDLQHCMIVVAKMMIHQWIWGYLFFSNTYEIYNQLDTHAHACWLCCHFPTV